MGRWKDAFARSLGPGANLPVDTPFRFGAPATPAQLAAVEAALGARLPDELRDLLQEFNGVQIVRDEDDVQDYFFSTEQMPRASEYYSDWGNELAAELCRKVAFVCQHNGWSEMWGVVLQPFADYQPGDIVGFDHDRVMFTEEEGDLFVQPYGSLIELVEARRKVSE